MELELVNINSIHTFKPNPKRGDIPTIRKSLKKNGQYRPLVVRKSTCDILAGNHTWLAAVEEEYKKIWITWIDCDDETAKRINLVDNRAPELGGYDQDALIAMLQDTPDLDGTGWSTEDLQNLLFKANPEPDNGTGTHTAHAPEAPTSTVQMAVLITCKNQQHQQQVVKALNEIRDDAASELVGTEIRAVTV